MKSGESPQRTFDRATIEAHAPDGPGVYILFRGDKCVYLGRGNIREKLLRHVEGDVECIVRHKPTHWYCIKTTSDLPGLERLLAAEFKPLCSETPH